MRMLVLSDLHLELWREYAPRFDSSVSRTDFLIPAAVVVSLRNGEIAMYQVKQGKDISNPGPSIDPNAWYVLKVGSTEIHGPFNLQPEAEAKRRSLIMPRPDPRKLWERK